MRATIKMIAERAGVSIGTVDRVLHDRPYVKEEVRQRVLEAMEELDYHPNRVASALATSGVARHFAIVQPVWRSYVGDAIAAGVEKFRRDRQDYNVSVSVHPYPQGETEACAAGAGPPGGGGPGHRPVRRRLPPDPGEAGRPGGAERVPVVTFNSDIAGGRRLCLRGGGRPPAPAGWPGRSPPSSSGPGTGCCWCTPTTATPATRAGRTASWSGWGSGAWTPGPPAGWRRPTTTTARPSPPCPPPWRRSRSSGTSTWPTGPSPPAWRRWSGRAGPGGCGSWPTTTAPETADLPAPGPAGLRHRPGSGLSEPQGPGAALRRRGGAPPPRPGRCQT